MEEIARRTGVSVGAVYRFFSNKADIVAALVERYGREHGTTAAAQLSPDNLVRPAEEVIGGYFQAFTALVAQQPGCRGLSRAGHLFGSSTLADTWTSDIEGLLAAQAPGLSAAARQRSARTFTGLSGWLILHAIESGDAIDEELREAATVMVGYIHELQR
jgi:AcrR family transcriptional regulator